MANLTTPGGADILTDDTPGSPTFGQPLTDGGFVTGILTLAPSITNPRYFAKLDGTVIYFQGSHTWNNFQDRGVTDPPPVFNYTAYVNWMQANNQNFMRLWVTEHTQKWQFAPDTFFWTPHPYTRTGPGNAADGKLRFDLNIFNQSYFDRLAQYVSDARDRGIYVAVMLFQGWSVSTKGFTGGTDPWVSHPYNGTNNINGVTAPNGLSTHGMTVPAVLTRQKALVAKVIDTVHGFDNVLYEISNEDDPGADRVAWANEIINYINTYQGTKPTQHPIGMTILWTGPVSVWDYPSCLASNAQWVSPGDESTIANLYTNPPVPTSKIILIDTDHTRPNAATSDVWTWKCFLRGYNVIHMDGLSGTGIPGADGADIGLGGGSPDNQPYNPPMRRGMQQTGQYAARCNLATTVPNSGLAQTTYCIANPGSQYLVLFPSGGTFTVNLTAGVGKSFNVEWLRVSDGVKSFGSVQGGNVTPFTSPFGAVPSVLFLNEGVQALSPSIISDTDALYGPNIVGGAPPVPSRYVSFSM